ncbi:hypothetical protein GHT06_003617 [Daphnia sinensis]|uniref:Uncharacterized protein n=1 Tax=Daphnia sinensis TaxID=1820382 RepID=A0AAD5KGA7_9CRUS|nr:hypothetical protein GHT06_003617 [Daphnia sinensis]
MAIEENQTRVRIHAAYGSPNIPGSRNELAGVLEALEKLNLKIDQTVAAQTSEFQQRIADVKRQLVPRQQGPNPTPRDPNPGQPKVLRKATLFCDFHNTYGFHTTENCFTKFQQRNDTCTTCRGTPAPRWKSKRSAPSTSRRPAASGGKLETTEPHVGPLGGYPKPQQIVQSVSKNPTTPRIRLQIGGCSVNALVDSGAGRSLINSTLFEKLRNKVANLPYSREVAVDLFDISNRPLICQGTLVVNVLVEDERPREPFQQEFIVVQGIMEECVLGLDALYQHDFVIDGRERRVY